jgi:SAM-dependent methyltransferase
MSWFLAAIYDRYMRKSEQACLASWRAELLAAARGDVLEVGAGTGANLPCYPAAVTRLVLCEPDPHMRARLAPRAAGRAELCAASADSLPFADASFDAVVSTLVLCSVPSPDRTLAELHRVLRPGGALLYLEHVAAEDPGRLRWQRRLEPVWRQLAGNCHLTRHTHDAIVRAGFTIDHEARESMRKALPILRPTIRGAAIRR